MPRGIPIPAPTATTFLQCVAAGAEAHEIVAAAGFPPIVRVTGTRPVLPLDTIWLKVIVSVMVAAAAWVGRPRAEVRVDSAAVV